MDQTRFDFSEEVPRRRRRRRRSPRRRGAGASELTPALTTAPQLQRCGRCGHEQTVLGETVVCARCGSIIMRQEPGEEEYWPPPRQPGQAAPDDEAEDTG